MDTNITSTVAKESDGTIQINFTIPFELVKTRRTETAHELAENIDVPGFRKGKAPIDKVLEKIPDNILLEKTLSKILPKIIATAIDKNNLKLAMYPKFELIKAKENEDWQISAKSCEIPEINLLVYKESIRGVLRSKSLWVPGKSKKDEVKPKREEIEHEILKTLLDIVKVTIPKILIEEETDSRIAKLLERLEKLGLSLESYLSSIGKAAEDLRNEYRKQSTESISMELILNKIADTENIKVDSSEIESALKVSSQDKELEKELESPDKRKLLELILRRRKALDFLASLI